VLYSVVVALTLFLDVGLLFFSIVCLLFVGTLLLLFPGGCCLLVGCLMRIVFRTTFPDMGAFPSSYNTPVYVTHCSHLVATATPGLMPLPTVRVHHGWTLPPHTWTRHTVLRWLRFSFWFWFELHPVTCPRSPFGFERWFGFTVNLPTPFACYVILVLTFYGSPRYGIPFLRSTLNVGWWVFNRLSNPIQSRIAVLVAVLRARHVREHKPLDLGLLYGKRASLTRSIVARIVGRNSIGIYLVMPHNATCHHMIDILTTISPRGVT